MPPVIATTDAGRPAAEMFTYATDPAEGIPSDQHRPGRRAGAAAEHHGKEAW